MLGRSASPQGNHSSCGSSPPLRRQGSLRSSSVPRSSPQLTEEVNPRPKSPQDNNQPTMDQPSGKKRQQSPERSLPHSPPHSRSTSPVQNCDFDARDPYLESSTTVGEKPIQNENVESSSPLDCATKVSYLNFN